MQRISIISPIERHSKLASQISQDNRDQLKARQISSLGSKQRLVDSSVKHISLNPRAGDSTEMGGSQTQSKTHWPIDSMQKAPGLTNHEAVLPKED